MIVREKLNELKGVNIKIGSKSGFVYCHKVDNNTIEELTAISYEYHKKFKRQLKDVEEYLKNFNTFWDVELRKRLDLALSERVLTKEDGEFIKNIWQQDKDKSYKEVTNKKATLTKYLKGWKGFTEREVKEVYDTISTQEPKGTKIIIVDGLEIGEYWTTKEYKAKNE